MSWLVSIGQRAREAAGAVGNVGGAARAALSSVTSFADDRARRLGQAVRARVLHGRYVMMDDAVARLERAVAECEPAQRPAMLRRWLAAIRATSEPTSETPTTTNDAPADDASGADETKRDKNDDDDAAADADKWASLEVAAGERADAARAGAEQDSAAAPSRGAHSPVDAFGLLPSDGAAVPIRDEGDAFEDAVVEGAVEGATALTFRDVVLRSGALEALVLSYVDAPSSGDVETSLLVELLHDALMFDVDEDAVDDDDAAVEESVVVEGGASRSAASRLVASLAAATDAIRAQGDAEVQLGAAELRAVVAAAVGRVQVDVLYGTAARRLRRGVGLRLLDAALGLHLEEDDLVVEHLVVRLRRVVPRDVRKLQPDRLHGQVVDDAVLLEYGDEELSLGERLVGVGVGAASAALSSAAIPGADNIKSLILQKERELHEMTEYRITTLEKSMKEKVWLGLALLRRWQ